MGVCPSYCEAIYNECKQDYFSLDSNNQLKVCRDDDIVCSKLKDIIADGPAKSTCHLLSQPVEDLKCWSGEVSARVKGRAKTKVKVPLVQKKNKPKGTFWIWQVIK